MKTEKEFEIYFKTQIKPSLEDLELKRQAIIQKYSFKFYRRTLLVLLILFVVAVIVAQLYKGTILQWGTLLAPLTGLFALVAPIVIWVMRSKENGPLIVEYKGIVKRKIISYLNDQMRYDPTSRIADTEFYSSGLFNEYFNSFVSDDLVLGKVNGAEIKISNVQAKRSGKNSSVIFQGVFLMAEYSKKFSGFVLVKPDASKSLLGRLGEDIAGSKINDILNSIGDKLQSMNCSHVLMEDVQFEKEFTVFASNPAEARQLLSKTLMLKLTELSKERGSFHISFINSRINIAVECMDPFVAASGESFISMDGPNEYLKSLTRALEIAESLEVNVPTGIPQATSAPSPISEKGSTSILEHEVVYKRTEVPYVLRLLWSLLSVQTIFTMVLVAIGLYGRRFSDLGAQEVFIVIIWIGLSMFLIILIANIFNSKKLLVEVELQGKNIKIKEKIFDRDEEVIVPLQRLGMSLMSRRRYLSLALKTLDNPQRSIYVGGDEAQLMKLAKSLAQSELGVNIEARTQLLLKAYEGRIKIPPILAFALRHIVSLVVLLVIGYQGYTNRVFLSEYYNDQLLPWINNTPPPTDPSFSEFLLLFGSNPPELDDQKKQLIKDRIPAWDSFYLPGKILLEYDDKIILSFQGNQFVYVAIAIMNKQNGTLISYGSIVERETDCSVTLSGFQSEDGNFVQADYFCTGEDGKTSNAKELFQISDSGEVSRVVQ